MKRILALILAGVLVLGLAACGNSDPAPATDGEGSGDSAGVTKLSMATGGTYYGFCGVVSQVLNEKLSDTLNISVQSTGASSANIDLVDTNGNQLAIVQNDVMYYANSGTDMYDGKDPITSFSAVMSCYPEHVQIIANKNITSIADLKGKKVSVGDAGSGVEFNARQILAAYDIDIENDISKNNQSFADSADSLKNGTIDAAFVVAGAPTTAITSLAASRSVYLVELDDEHIDKLIEASPYYSKNVITGAAKDAYKLSADATTVAVGAVIIARDDCTEGDIYNVCAGIFDSIDTLGHDKKNELDLDFAASITAVPYHPGAAKYFADKNLTVPTK